MIPWRDTVFALGAHPDIADLLLSSRPALVFARDGSSVLWANPAGALAAGARDFPALAARRWPDTHPLRRTIAGLARSAPAGGTLARLRLTDAPPALPLTWRCTFVRAGETRGLLVTALEDAAGAAPSLPLLAAFFTGAGAAAAIVDAEGNRVASGVRDGAAVPDSAPSVDFACEGKSFRLLIAERAAGAAVRPVRAAPPAPFDGPALSAILAELGVQVSATPPDRVEPPVIRQQPAPTVRSPGPRLDPAPLDASRPEPLQRPSPPPPLRIERTPAPPPPAAREAAERPISAGRVAQDLSRKPVRFLWQTDGSDRFLFVSPGLPQVVGRSADIVGERWQEVADRLRLDPAGRIAKALRDRDTWSGLIAWWPVEGSNVRVPAELTALPVFGADQSFQGYRGFGILRPAEALMPGAFEARFGTTPAPSDAPPVREGVPANVVPIRADIDPLSEPARLSPQERNAFEEIAAALQSRVLGVPAERVDDEEPEAEAEPIPPRDPAGERDSADPTTPPHTPLRDDDAPRMAAPAEPGPVTGGVAAETVLPADEPPSEPRLAAPVVPSEEAAAALQPRTVFVSPGDADLRGGPRNAGMGARLADAQRRVAELTAILDTATDGVLILDADGIVESVNASGEALFGLDAGEILGRRLDALLTGETRKVALDYLSGLRDSGVASLLNEGREVAAKAGAGSIPVFMTLGRLSTDGASRFCAVLRDITHFKRIESDLRGAKVAAEAASHQKSDFLARVSHEIRTPLNAIIGFAEVMIEERFGAIENERYRDYLRDIRTSGEHVVSLVNDLLDISKIEAGKLDLTFAAVPLNDLLREAIGLMQPQANRARVVLRSSLAREVPAVVADARTLRQIVLNLLSNSVKFTPPGGQVIASTSLSEGGEAVLRIRDTGEGMTEAELARALEPFRQLSTASIADRGTGLGLPLTMALVEANRASMTIKSARGEGTVVTITIPPTRVLSE